MWPFSKSTRKMEAEARRSLSEYISEDAIEAVIRNPSGILAERERTHVTFVLFHVRDDVLENIPIYLEQNVQLAIDAGALVDTMLCSLVFVWFLERDEGGNAVKQSALVDALTRQSNANVRVVYGNIDGLRGNFGSSGRFQYTSLFTNLKGALDLLFSLDFGKSAKLQ